MLLQEFSWKTEVLQSAEPVLVDFWAPWCGPCQLVHPVMESVAGDYKVCQVNIDSNQELASRYGVSAVPTLMIVKDGKEVSRHVGVTEEGVLRRELEELKRKP